MAIIERTEEEQVGQLPIKIRLGAKVYEVKPLSINRARVWRVRLIDSVTEAAGAMRQSGTLTTQFLEGLKSALLAFPEKVGEFVFEYAPDLPREQVLEEATEEQLAIAFAQIMAVAFPFTRQLQQMQVVIREFANLSR